MWMQSYFVLIGHKKTNISFSMWAHAQRNLFEILINQPEIRLYLPFSDWFVTKRTSIWIQIIRKMVNTIWFQVDLIRFQKYFSVCTRSMYNNLETSRLFYSTCFWQQCWSKREIWHNDVHNVMITLFSFKL